MMRWMAWNPGKRTWGFVKTWGEQGGFWELELESRGGRSRVRVDESQSRVNDWLPRCWC